MKQSSARLESALTPRGDHPVAQPKSVGAGGGGAPTDAEPQASNTTPHRTVTHYLNSPPQEHYEAHFPDHPEADALTTAKSRQHTTHQTTHNTPVVGEQRRRNTRQKFRHQTTTQHRRRTANPTNNKTPANTPTHHTPLCPLSKPVIGVYGRA